MMRKSELRRSAHPLDHDRARSPNCRTELKWATDVCKTTHVTLSLGFAIVSVEGRVVAALVS
jgi:hypothetical protein